VTSAKKKQERRSKVLHRRRGGSGGGNGQAAGAPIGGSECEGEGGVGLVCARRGCDGYLGVLYRPGMGWEAAPGGHGHEWPFGLDFANQEGVLKRGNCQMMVGE
jgi:hypothetical protein